MSTPAPWLITVTGASGAGKTTLVRSLESRRDPGVKCYYFDSVGVPSPEEMARDYGSGEAWQAAMTDQWIRRLARNPDDARVMVLDGQVRPSVLHEAFERYEVQRGEIILIDCARAVREARLTNDRGQAELASQQMAEWAAYLRGQADALRLRIVDTTNLSRAEAELGFCRMIQSRIHTDIGTDGK
ncbi:MAG: AAA family ATPase [Gemmatimonadales bacterium]